MGSHTKIEWTDATWNPIRARNRETGKVGWFCTHVSEGCRNCYAERMNIWRGNGVLFHPSHEAKVELFLDEKILRQPLHCKKPRRIFVCDMTDLFLDAVLDLWIQSVFAHMVAATRIHGHIFQVLTKRPQRMREVVRFPFKDLWLGVSVEDQKTADERIPILLETPAAVRWVSYEPALGPVDFSRWFCCKMEGHLHLPSLDWIVCGGESGPGARPMHPDWARSARDQCVAAGVPFFFKQHGQFLQSEKTGLLVRVRSKKVAGRRLDGREWNEFPVGADQRVRPSEGRTPGCAPTNAK